ncbi:HNH endonuclease family protein, partial [Streptomyces geysiriensis]
MLTTVLRGLAAASLAVLPLTLPTPAHAAETLPLSEAVSRLPVDTESRDGYDRDAFKHWNSGDDPADGCHTRNEVLIAEAVEPPTIGPRCRLSGGSWFSYYDQVEVTSASGLDIDHMVPLAESWDSGASAWTPQRREAYANDQGAA